MKAKKAAQRLFFPRERPGDIPVTIFLSPDVARIFDEFHKNIPFQLLAEAERVLDHELHMAFCRYHAIVGMRNLGIDTSEWERTTGKPELKLVPASEGCAQ
jgi:hypothetical protein